MVKNFQFYSVFAKELDNYVTEKRSVGYKFDKGASILKRLDVFLEFNNLREKRLPKELVTLWITKNPNESISTQSGRISTTRGFAQYLVRLGYDAYIIPGKVLKLYRYSYTPHIFTEQELKNIFLASDSYAFSELTPYRHLALSLLFRLLYGTGLRISEALKLKISDVNLIDGVLYIKEAKFGKERFVPLSNTLTARCATYLERIYELNYSGVYFFPSPYGGHYNSSTMYKYFRDLIWQAGISHSGKGPRVHDFRHTFAVHCLKKWVLKGEDLTNLLPYLSVYLGHKDLRGTQHYLKLTAELYPAIISNMENHFSYLIPEVNFHETN